MNQGYGPPPGYGQPPPGAMVQQQQQQQQQQPGAYGPAPMQGGAPGQPTAWKVPLEPGERVIHHTKFDYLITQIIYIVLGVLLLIVIVGLFFILWGALMGMFKPKAVIVTNRRVILIDANGKPKWLALYDITNVTARRNYYRGGGIAGAIVTVAVTAMAESNQTWQPSYWYNSTAVNCHARSGATMSIPVRNATVLGPLIARAIHPGAADQFPTVVAPA